ncbi:MAG: DUF971 domain-containing protein [Anaerolineales bacterium]|nr:DUF971 domain-containing protein [Anaerolineales bacterium]
MKEKAAGITAKKSNQQVIISWADGHTSHYPFGLLRAACPCASCRGGHENMGSEPDPEVFDVVTIDSPATHLETIKAVGSYAIMIVWEDGHDYGIYNWHYLRALCPCDECRGG